MALAGNLCLCVTRSWLKLVPIYLRDSEESPIKLFLHWIFCTPFHLLKRIVYPSLGAPALLFSVFFTQEDPSKKATTERTVQSKSLYIWGTIWTRNFRGLISFTTEYLPQDFVAKLYLRWMNVQEAMSSLGSGSCLSVHPPTPCHTPSEGSVCEMPKYLRSYCTFSPKTFCWL